ncbi:hypothetical protein Tco_1160831, partial [Tanacetum coccineum]
DHRKDRPEVTLPPRKRLGIALGPRYEIGKSSSAAARPAGGLRIVEAMQWTPIVTDVAEFSQRMTEFKTRVRRDIDEVYTRLDDEQTGRQLLVGLLNMLFRDRRTHARTARLMETEARMRQTMITEILEADHKRQVQLNKALKLVKRLQTQMAELQRQQGPAKGPTQPEPPEEAGCSS